MTAPHPPWLRVAPDVADALRRGRPVVALESTLISHGLPWPANLDVAERVLPGVAERRVAEIVRQRHGFHQVFAQAQRPRDGTPQLRDFDGVRQARAEQVTLVIEEHLRLVDQAAKSRRMHDAVAIALECVAWAACRIARFGVEAAAMGVRVRGIGGGHLIGTRATFCPTS